MGVEKRPLCSGNTECSRSQATFYKTAQGVFVLFAHCAKYKIIYVTPKRLLKIFFFWEKDFSYSEKIVLTTISHTTESIKGGDQILIVQNVM